MITELRAPQGSDRKSLLLLWQAAFGDKQSEIERFFKSGYSPERARCLLWDGRLAAALYWLDGELRGKRIAYLYAIATDPALRGRGLCTALMRDTHSCLASSGYAGAALVPASPSLFDFYSRLGYKSVTTVREMSCSAATPSLSLRQLEKEEYALLRRKMLPEGALIQEGAALDYLASYAELYAGEDILLALTRKGAALRIHELLGDPSLAPRALTALSAESATLRTPGDGRPFAMYLPFSDTPAPTYLGIALD